MRFVVDGAVFERLPGLFFGCVAGYGIDNTRPSPEAAGLLARSAADRRAAMEEGALKTHPAILPYREAFQALGINPNKYMSSVEAMLKRVLKGHDLPSINPVVDIGNALSLKYLLPMGAHDLDRLSGEISVRFSREGDLFQPLGEEGQETPEPGELIYADEKRVRTRRWIWRQSEMGKIDASSRNIFFPIDGFADRNRVQVEAAAAELQGLLEQTFCCKTAFAFVDREHPFAEL